MDCVVDQSTRLGFTAEWYIDTSDTVQPYIIYYYPYDQGVEVIDVLKNKVFLRRRRVYNLFTKDFARGVKVNIFGRCFDVIDFFDDFTRNALSRHREPAFLLIKYSALHELSTIVMAIEASDFLLVKGSMVQFTTEQARLFLSNMKDSKDFSRILVQLLAGPCVCFKLTGLDAVAKLCSYLLLSEHDETANTVTTPLGELFKKELYQKGMYVPGSKEEALHAIKFLFGRGNKMQMCYTENDSALALIKPHVLASKQAGKVLKHLVDNGMKITGLRLIRLPLADIQEFYEMYRTVYVEYFEIIEQIQDGPCLIVVLTCDDKTENASDKLRALCGPKIPVIGRTICPNTIRAKYGINRIKNCIHSPDILRDVVPNIKFLFDKVQW